MDSTKLIIGILIVVYFVVKTIFGNTKKEHKKNDAQPKKNPKTVFPPFFYDEKSQSDVPEKKKEPSFMQEGQVVTKASSITPPEIEDSQVDVERWRQALIDSEILKTKF